MDQDRYCGPVEMGHTAMTLKEAKQTVEVPENFSTSLFLKEAKKVIFRYSLSFRVQMNKQFKL